MIAGKKYRNNENDVKINGSEDDFDTINQKGRHRGKHISAKTRYISRHGLSDAATQTFMENEKSL